MGHHQGGAVGHEAIQGLLNDLFGCRIKGRRGLIQKQDRGIFDQGPGNGHPLPLPPRQHRSIFTNQGVVAIGQLHDEIMGICCTGCSLNPFRAGFGMAIGDIVSDGVIKEKGILINNRDLLAQTL